MKPGEKAIYSLDLFCSDVTLREALPTFYANSYLKNDVR